MEEFLDRSFSCQLVGNNHRYVFFIAVYKKIERPGSVLEMTILLNHEPFDESMKYRTSDNHKGVSQRLMETVKPAIALIFTRVGLICVFCRLDCDSRPYLDNTSSDSWSLGFIRYRQRLSFL